VTEAACRRTYDHRLRELAYHAGDPGVAQRLGVPRSTARSWIRRGMPDAVTLDVFDADASELHAQVVRLENRVRMLLAIVRLLFSVKQGVRATKPNEYWHIDVTIIKLLDGTKVYLHAVIDNLSRRILAWKVALRLEV